MPNTIAQDKRMASVMRHWFAKKANYINHTQGSPVIQVPLSGQSSAASALLRGQEGLEEKASSNGQINDV
jgi:hypothetical protein